MPRRQTDTIRSFILAQVAEHPTDIAKITAEEFGISRQAVHRQLSRLVAEGRLTAEGKTRGRVYRAGTRKTWVFPVTPKLEEHGVWDRHVEPLLTGLPKNVLGICSYGFTEMLNNVVDHSDGSQVIVRVERDPGAVQLLIHDDGVGLFRKIREEFDLESESLAIFELVKGKLTTDPERHTGEGIFFTSRMFDRFMILSGTLGFGRRQDTHDWLIDSGAAVEGTCVSMMLDPATGRTAKEVFDRYATEQEDYAFSRTHLLLAMAQAPNQELISRSQAKRVLSRLERFREVILDFQAVESIGPAFADEIFRVFVRAHPEVALRVMNAVPDVLQMIRRAQAHERADG